MPTHTKKSQATYSWWCLAYLLYILINNQNDQHNVTQNIFSSSWDLYLVDHPTYVSHWNHWGYNLHTIRGMIHQVDLHSNQFSPGLHQHQPFDGHRDQHPGAPSLRKCRDSHSSLAAATAVKKCRWGKPMKPMVSLGKWSYKCGSYILAWRRLLCFYLNERCLQNSHEQNSTNPGMFHVTKTGFPSWCSKHAATKDIMNFPVSAARHSEWSDKKWQPGLWKSIASLQTHEIFRQFQWIKFRPPRRMVVFQKLWYSGIPQTCWVLNPNIGSMMLDDLPATVRVPSGVPWGIAPSQVVSHWQWLHLSSGCEIPLLVDDWFWD